MTPDRLRFCMTSGVIFAVIGLGTKCPGNEILKVVANPSNVAPNPSNANITYYATTVVVGVKAEMTSGQPDTVQMNYYCTDSANNNLPCSPAPAPPPPGDDLSVSKTIWPTDSCTINITNAVGPTLNFTAYAVGQNEGGSYTYTQSFGLTYDHAPPAPAHAHAPRTPLTPTVAFSPLFDYTVGVQAIFDAGVDSKVRMTYKATSSAGIPISCVPASETITVHDFSNSIPPSIHQVVLHAFGANAGDVITFTAKATSLDFPPIAATADSVKYTVLTGPLNPVPNPPAPAAAPVNEPAFPSGLHVFSYPIAPANLYVASVMFPGEGAKVHVNYYIDDPTVTSWPTQADLTIPAGTPVTQNITIDFSGKIGTLQTFEVQGNQSHAGPFFAAPTYTPVLQ